MVGVPGGSFTFVDAGIEVESMPLAGTDVQFPWETSPSMKHSQRLKMQPLWVDAHPVTNELYSQFLNESGWRPTDEEAWLLHWGKNWSVMPRTVAEQPVTYVSLSDARAFCAYYGKRLPHSWEWQWAAGQAMGDQRPYPWGTSAPSAHTQ